MKQRLIVIGYLIVGLAFSLSAQQFYHREAALDIGANYRIYPGEVTQTEVFIATSPVNQDILFSSCNTLTFIPFFVSEGIYVTTDGGDSWQGNDSCLGEPVSFHGGDPGIAIDKYGTFIITRLGRSPFAGLYSHYSNDNGKTWSVQQAVSTDDLERASVASDASGASTHYGRTYSTWVKLAPPFPVMLAYTDDGAGHWSTPQQVNNPVSRSAGGDIEIGPAGEVYICWAGVTETSPFKEILVGFASSEDGGSHWNVNEDAFEVNGITGVLADKDNIRVNGLPGIAVDTTNSPVRGRIYIVSGQKELAPAGADPDIILNYSDDGGITWSGGIRVNQDPLNNGKIQYFPSVHVDKFGAVNVIFYDDRNTTADSSGVFLARSTDGGISWSEYEISDHNYKPTPIGGLGQGYQGDNIDLTSTNSGLWPVWMDNSTGIYQIWTAPIDFSYFYGIDDLEDKRSIYELKQNYPNPFKASTCIGFSILEKALVSLKIFDIQGNEVSEPLHKEMTPGYYEYELGSDELSQGGTLQNSLSSGGIYYYRLEVNGKKSTRKMLFLP